MKTIPFILPYIILPLITPIYNILDSLVFVEIFGCGCVPITQENMFGIPFNANYLRLTVYGIISLLMGLLSRKLFGSHKLSSKYMCSERKKAFTERGFRLLQILYTLSVLIVNLILGYLIYQNNMWA